MTSHHMTCVNCYDVTNNSDRFRFEQLFVKAYLTLRKHAEEFLTLWHLILTAGLKEVNKASHLEHLTTVSWCLGYCFIE